jgi:hypothetical protein
MSRKQVFGVSRNNLIIARLGFFCLIVKDVALPDHLQKEIGRVKVVR